jgi:hypothetical protein
MRLGLGDSAKMFDAELVNGLQNWFMGLLSNADPAHFLQLSTLPMTNSEKLFYFVTQSLETGDFGFFTLEVPRNLIYAVKTQGSIRETLSPI